MASAIYTALAGGGENWQEASTVSPADGPKDVSVVVTDATSNTPTKHEAATAVRRLADYLTANEGGAWPLT